MSVAENDLQLLETYLDGELPMSEAEGLWRRLAAESSLTAALDDLRAQRATRSMLWLQLEPADQKAAAVADRVFASVRRRRIWDRSYQMLSYVAAAAACLFIGFNAGWWERGSPASVRITPPAAVQQVADSQTANSNDLRGAVAVPIFDSGGNVIARPRFDSQAEAADFINSLKSLQTRSQPQQARDLGSNVVPVSDEQF